jgi:hypothetical protein
VSRQSRQSLAQAAEASRPVNNTKQSDMSDAGSSASKQARRELPASVQRDHFSPSLAAPPEAEAGEFPSSTKAEGRLPDGWEERRSKSQPHRSYFENKALGISQWERPGSTDV